MTASALRQMRAAEVDASAVRQVVLRTISPDEAVIDAIEDDGRQLVIRFRLVVDPVVLTERMAQVSEALMRAGHAREMLPMLRLI